MVSEDTDAQSSDEFEITKTFEDFEVGETFHSTGRTVTNADIRMFIGATGSTHPNHVDRPHSVQHPVLDLDDVVAQGVLTLSIADGFLAQTVVDDPGILALNYGYGEIRFLDPVYPDDTIYATLEVTDKDDRDDQWGELSIEILASKETGEDVLYAENSHLIAKAGFEVDS